MLQIKDVQARYGALAREQFLKKVRCDWLVTDAPVSDLGESAETTVFNVREVEKLRERAREHETNLQDGKIAIYPIIKRNSNPKSKIVTLGRASSNDVVIPDSSMSKVHAYFGLDEKTQRRTICDMDSTNGTFISGEQCIANVAYLLKTGDQLMFGRLSYTYYTPRSFYDVFLSS